MIRTKVFAYAFLVLIFQVMRLNSAVAAPLEKGDDVYAHLEEIGYKYEVSNNNWSKFVRRDGRFLSVSKREDHITICNGYDLRAPTAPLDRLNLLSLINQINSDRLFQVNLTCDQSIISCIHYFLPYGRHSFAVAMQYIEQSRTIFDDYPKLRDFTD